ncbi:SseB family protein [Streptomyces sp. MRC013]|uniref:SseB family protein n=1 Tax=Streptomyces sp. MRC013 TaxID=2898276 RepID=UPI0020270B89|nr:SseB family protein [Streptomyces sp. MRC013]URM92709.1 SseB family protein [Streptomyces sp. MRC013]
MQRLFPDAMTEARREFAVLLGEFRRTAVLVPLADGGGLWTADLGGVRWICAFSHEESLARFARARGEADRVWEYRTVLGARLLDVMVPLLGVPGGVALDAGGADGVLFPPARGVVPDAAAVDLDDEREGGLHER